VIGFKALLMIDLKLPVVIRGVEGIDITLLSCHGQRKMDYSELLVLVVVQSSSGFDVIEIQTDSLQWIIILMYALKAHT
jgi:hypothetical protein